MQTNSHRASSSQKADRDELRQRFGPRTTHDIRAELAGGDAATWADVVARYHRLLLSVTRRYRLNDADAADVVQRTWTRLFEHAGQVRDPERLAGWLVTTASRECIAVRRRAWREAPVPEMTITDTPEDVSDRLLGEYRARALRAAVATLPTRQRRLIEVMLEPQPLTYAEISRRLQMPIGSIGPIRGRALRRLRGTLHALDPAAPDSDATTRLAQAHPAGRLGRGEGRRDSSGRTVDAAPSANRLTA